MYACLSNSYMLTASKVEENKVITIILSIDVSRVQKINGGTFWQIE